MNEAAQAAAQAAAALRRSRLARLSPQTRQAIRRARRRYLRAAERIGTAAWARKYRKLASGAKKGDFSFDEQPAIEGILDAYDDPRVRELWTQKCSQFGYTQGVELNIVGRHIHVDPVPMMILFPKEQDAKRWSRTKLKPAIKATPELQHCIPLDKRGPDNTWDYKEFSGGYVQLAAVNSPGNVKSDDVPIVIVSEPDDTSKTVGGQELSQGDAISLGRERLKSYPNGKLIVGGTATVAGFSQVDDGMQRTDKRRYFVECPACGHFQHLRWEQVHWEKDAEVPHQVYGTHRPETARYLCEACEDAWSDAKKSALIRIAARRADKGWRATAPFRGAAGFYINELMSVMEGSRMELLVTKFLEAEHKLRTKGDDSAMRAFVNNQEGRAWTLKSEAPEIETLKQRTVPYAEWTVPDAGLIVTGFVDVQRGHSLPDGQPDPDRPPRLEVLLRAWGRELESWLVYFGIVVGNPQEAATWDALDKLLCTPIKHAGGGLLGISALGVDSGDGVTQAAVLTYCRRSQQKRLHVYPTKGAKTRDREIFTKPDAFDFDARDRAARWGLQLYSIGTQKAKDDISGRLRLVGDGPRRMHVYSTVRADYFEQLTSEVKIPGRDGKLSWSLPAGRANEALDCEVGALHGAFKLKLHSYTDQDWTALQRKVLQGDLLKTWAENAEPTRTPPPSAAQPIGAAQPFTGFGGERGGLL